MFIALAIQHAMCMRNIVIWPARFNNIFPHYFINSTIFNKKRAWNTKFVFWFCLQILSEAFFILRRTERHVIINACWFSCKVPNIKFHKNPFHGSRVVACRRTDGHITKLIIAFRNFVNASRTNQLMLPTSISSLSAI